jgi:predicted nucleic-acid-binding protein
LIAIDTNVLVRLITDDDLKQSAQARQLVLANECLVARSVILEVVWVLQKSYKATPEQIAEVIEKLIGTERFVVEDEEAIAQSIIWFRQGLDFADALHLATATSPTPKHPHQSATLNRPCSLSLKTLTSVA